MSFKDSSKRIPPLGSLGSAFSTQIATGQPDSFVDPANIGIVSRETPSSTVATKNGNSSASQSGSSVAVAQAVGKAQSSPVLNARPQASKDGSDKAAPNVIDSLDDSTPLARELASENKRREKLAGRSLPRPDETRVFTVSNQKGGVGKTTTTVNIAAALAGAGLNVLVVDIDPQGNASTALGVEHHAEVTSIYDVLINDVPMSEVVSPSADIPSLLCAPATIHLAGAEIELVSLVAREQRLRRALDVYAKDRDKSGQERLDYIFVDCPPSLGLLTVNAFVAAGEVLIPIQCEYYALEGLSQLLKNIEMIQKHLNADLVVSTILLTMYDGRTNLAAQVASEVREHFPEQVLGAVVPRSVRISEAPSYQQTVMTYDPSSSGALSYLEAATEIAERKTP